MFRCMECRISTFKFEKRIGKKAKMSICVYSEKMWNSTKIPIIGWNMASEPDKMYSEKM